MPRALPTPPAALRPRGFLAPGPWLGAATVALLALVPLLVTGPGPLRLGAVLFLAVLQAAAWNLVGGLAGQLSLGHALYFGAGACAVAVLQERWASGPWWGLAAAPLVAVVLALPVGALTQRLRGPWHVLATLAAAELVRQAALRLPALGRSAHGLAAAGPAGARPVYLVALLLAALAVAVNRAVLRSRLGYRLQAFREDPEVARALGADAVLGRIGALALSAGLTGLAGGAFAAATGVADPDAVFSLAGVSVPMALACLLGGAGTVGGPVVGALLLAPVLEALRDPRTLVSLGLLAPGSQAVELLERHRAELPQLACGVLLALVAFLGPGGVAGLARRPRARPRSAPPTPA
jgi:branched-chain amino acid transport system permease protein